MKKRYLVLVLLSLLVLALPLLAGAEIVDSGTCGPNLTWTLNDNGLLTISGTGDMYSYDGRPGPWGQWFSRSIFGKALPASVILLSIIADL